MNNEILGTTLQKVMHENLQDNPFIPTVKFKKVNDLDIPLPSYATSGSACMDVQAAIHKEEFLAPGYRVAIGIGYAVEIPIGWEMQIRPRSGMALNRGLTVANTPGCIDSDYRGEVKVILINHSDELQRIRPFDRIAQINLSPVHKMKIELVDELSKTERADGSFGSTGV